MPIQLHNVDDRTRVVVVCDHCQQPISRAEDGNCEYMESAPGAKQAPFFTHKACSDPFRAVRPDIALSMELTAFPVYLVANLELDFDDAVKLTAALRELG